MELKWDDHSGVILHDLGCISDCRLVVCKDYRVLDITNLSNLLLAKIGRIDDFYIFSWRGHKQRALINLNIKRQVISELILVLNAYPQAASFTSVYLDRKGLVMSLPNRAFLKIAKAESLVDRLLG